MGNSDTRRYLSENLTKAFNTFDLTDFDQLPPRKLYKIKPRSFVLLPSAQQSIIFYFGIDGDFGECETLDRQPLVVDAFAEAIPLVRKEDKPS